MKFGVSYGKIIFIRGDFPRYRHLHKLTNKFLNIFLREREKELFREYGGRDLEMRRIIKLTLLLVVGVILVACSEKEGQLTRVDVQKVNEEGNYDDVLMITEIEDIELIEEAILNVNWEPNTEAKMARIEDVLAILFFSFDENMPERLYEYRIWFDNNETATIISNNENEGYGKLNKKDAQNLKSILFK